MKPPSAPAAVPEDIDLLIRPEWIIPIEPAGVTLSGHALAVRDGRIVALLPDEEAMQRFRPQQTLDLPGQVLQIEHLDLPGEQLVADGLRVDRFELGERLAVGQQ